MRELDLHKAKNADKAKQKNDAKNAKPKSVLEAFEYIVLTSSLKKRLFYN